MKFIIGLLVSFAVGAGCRYFDIPVGSPAVLPGALLVLAMTGGYASTNRMLDHTSRPATTAQLCGGPTGSPAPLQSAEQKGSARLSLLAKKIIGGD